MTREKLIKELKLTYWCITDDDLMNGLQDRGLVSDEAVHLEDCADRDLIAALQRGQYDPAGIH